MNWREKLINDKYRKFIINYTLHYCLMYSRVGIRYYLNQIILTLYLNVPSANYKNIS